MLAGGISLYAKSELIIIDEHYTVNDEYYRNKIMPIYEKSSKNRQQYPGAISRILI